MKIEEEFAISLESNIGYRFNNLQLLKQAITHPSLKQINPDILHYERFEILGDSILGFIVTELIFDNFKNDPEGSIARIKAHCVSRDVILKVGIKIDIANYIIMSKGEINSLGKINPNNIENSTEALIAAIYLDSDMTQTKSIVKNLWGEYIVNDINFNDVDPKTSLQEKLQATHNITPRYETIHRTGSAHSPLFTVKIIAGELSEIASGNSIKEAQKNAARKMLNNINS